MNFRLAEAMFLGYNAVVPRKRHPKAFTRPQVPETWAVSVTQLRTWIRPEGEKPYRPFLVIALDLTNGFVVHFDLAESLPEPEDVLHALKKGMNKPAPGAGKPRRPERVVFAEPALTEALAEPLAALGITCETGPLPMVDEIVRELASHMRGDEPEHPGLLSAPGVTPAMAGGFFAAAADFYRAAPWVKLTNGQAFAVRFPAEGGPERIVSVMGNGGVEYGLAVYPSWERFSELFLANADDPWEVVAPEGQAAILFDDVAGLPFEDYEALEEHGWEVAADQAYPLALVFRPGDEPVRPPSAEELGFLEAAARAVALAVRDHLKPDGQGDYQPFEVLLAVPTHAGAKSVFVRYPAGQLALEKGAFGPPAWEGFDDEADEDEDDLPAIDQRAMEGMMAKLGRDLGGEPLLDDPKLRQAQELMYKAWEETNPAKRLSLAHEALALSPDCADAYVLLAEEEADTLARAAEYFRQGMEAGERALGREFFKENKGRFWGILETRPYMRARAGLAHCLWQLNRREEAVEHYRALLKLNPNDNQGNRHVLAALLLDMDRDEELIKLLKQYDDGMAEWLYTRALVEFRRSGPSKAADRRLAEAIETNEHVPAYLLGKKRVPLRLPPYITWGSEDEAMHYAAAHLNYWRRTPGAVDWLKTKWKG